MQSKIPERLKQLKGFDSAQPFVLSNVCMSEDKVSNFYSPKVMSAYCGLDLIVSGLQFFSIVESNAFLRAMK